MKKFLEIVFIVFLTSPVCYSQPYRYVKDVKEIPRGWICVGIAYSQEDIGGGGWKNIPEYQIEDGTKYPKGKQIMTCLLDNLDRTEWNVISKIEDCIYCYYRFKQGIPVYKYAGWTIVKVTENSTNNSGEDGYIADEDRPKFIPYTPNTPAQIAAHNAKVAKDKENAWLAGQSNWYFYSTNPNKEFLVFVYQLHPSNQTSFQNNQRAGSIVIPSFIANAMDLNKLVVARPVEKYFVKEPTIMDAQNPAMIWVKLENKFKYRIYVVSKGENIWQGWEVSAPRDNPNILFNVNMTNPKPFPPPPKMEE